MWGLDTLPNRRQEIWIKQLQVRQLLKYPKHELSLPDPIRGSREMVKAPTDGLYYFCHIYGFELLLLIQMTCLQAVCQAMSSLWLSHFEICPSGLFLSPSFSLLHSVWVLIRDTKSCPHCPSAGHRHSPPRQEWSQGWFQLCHWAGLRLGSTGPDREQQAGVKPQQSCTSTKGSESKASVINVQPVRFMHNMPTQLPFLQI